MLPPGPVQYCSQHSCVAAVKPFSLVSVQVVHPYVIYWPSTEPSVKRCTCVNKRKNSGSRWTIENNITRYPGGSSHLETGCRSENQLQTEGFWFLVTLGRATQAKMRKKHCYGRGRTWVNIAVRLCLHSFLTHNKHHLFENKVWEIYIFIKKCIRSLLESSLSVDYVLVYICIRIRAVVCGYTTHIAVSTRSLLGRYCVSFYRSGLISI